MEEQNEIRDDEIRIIGGGEEPATQPIDNSRNAGGSARSSRRFLLIAAAVSIIVGGVRIADALLSDSNGGQTEQSSAEQTSDSEHRPQTVAPAEEQEQLGCEADSLACGFSEISDASINDIPL
ncbi:MAG: hypothetical protein K2F95_03100 [Alistipes sp.]|nr:hypothetical protein [Alistipes sp.]